MASRITQEGRAVVLDVSPAALGGAARVTQETRAIIIDPTPATTGGLARVTQVSRVVVCTIQLTGGGLPSLGVGQ